MRGNKLLIVRKANQIVKDKHNYADIICSFNLGMIKEDFDCLFSRNSMSYVCIDGKESYVDAYGELIKEGELNTILSYLEHCSNVLETRNDAESEDYLNTVLYPLIALLNSFQTANNTIPDIRFLLYRY